ncbi:MAG: phosphoribosyltransferase family protein [Candidatus Saccharimonadales bacterium]
MANILNDGVMVGETKMAVRELLSARAIQERITSLGAEIAAHYAGLGSIHTVTVLNGALHFASALRLAVAAANETLAQHTSSDTVHLASYHGTDSSGKVEKISDLTHSVEGKHVLVLEDIIDTGRTLSVLIAELKEQKPASFAIAALLRKPEKLAVPAENLGPDVYVGFDIGPEFVVGYGLDYEGLYRDLSAIYALSPSE